MDQATLVNTRIDEGKRLIERLVEEGVVVNAAFWAREVEDGMWFLYIATPLVDVDGATRKAYRRLSEIIRRMSPPLKLGALKIKVIGPKDPLAEAVADMSHHHAWPGSLHLGSESRVLGGLGIEVGHIYPPVTPDG